MSSSVSNNRTGTIEVITYLFHYHRSTQVLGTPSKAALIGHSDRQLLVCYETRGVGCELSSRHRPTTASVDAKGSPHCQSWQRCMRPAVKHVSNQLRSMKIDRANHRRLSGPRVALIRPSSTRRNEFAICWATA